MAKIVFAFGSSHGPTIETRPENWDDIVARDMKDPRYRYEDLLRKANPALRKEITLEEKQRRWNASQIAIAKIKTKLAEAKPDVAVVVSNPHGILPDDTIAVFGVFRGETLSGRTGPPLNGRVRRAIRESHIHPKNVTAAAIKVIRRWQNIGSPPWLTMGSILPRWKIT